MPISARRSTPSLTRLPGACASPFALPDAIPTPGNIRYLRGVRRIDRLVDTIIKERQADADVDRGDLLSMLMLARDEDGKPMTARQLRDEVITLLLAGHETTALALSWAWYLLAQHPEADAKLAAELRDVLGGRAPAASDLPRLRYAEQVVTEAMRLYPPAWGFGREALVDCEIDGYAIPAGTTVIISPWVLHRDPRYFEGPMEFRPERWRRLRSASCHAWLISRSAVGLASAWATGLP